MVTRVEIATCKPSDVQSVTLVVEEVRAVELLIKHGRPTTVIRMKGGCKYATLESYQTVLDRLWPPASNVVVTTVAASIEESQIEEALDVVEEETKETQSVVEQCCGCERSKRLDMSPTNFDHTCGDYPAQGLVTVKPDPRCEQCNTEVPVTIWRRHGKMCPNCYRKEQPIKQARAQDWLNVRGVITDNKSPAATTPVPVQVSQTCLLTKPQTMIQPSNEDLLKALHEKYPIIGEFLVQDAMQFSNVSAKATQWILKGLEKVGRVTHIGPFELEDQQKWKLVKQHDG